MSRQDVKEIMGLAADEIGLKEIAFVSVGSQGAVTAADILASAAIKEGKYVSVSLYVRGERSNSPVVNSIRIAERPPVPSCGVRMPSELLVLDEAMYFSDAEKANEAIVGLESGVLMVCTDKDPEEVGFPYDFTGTIATANARTIGSQILGLTPPPFGTAALGLYAAATNTVGFEAIKEAIREAFPGKAGDRNVQAAELVYESAKVKNGVRLAGKQPRPAHAYLQIPFDEVPEFVGLQRRPLPGISGGNTFVWREELPTWEEAKCTCGAECVLVSFCPERTISYKNHVIYKEYDVDYEYCKGCGICAVECLHGAITMKNAKEVYGR